MAKITSYSFEQYLESIERRLAYIQAETYLDENGVLRWKSNKTVPPLDTLEFARKEHFVTPAQFVASEEAWAVQDAAIWAPIHAYCKELREARGEVYGAVMAG